MATASTTTTTGTPVAHAMRMMLVEDPSTKKAKISNSKITANSPLRLGYAGN